MKDWILSHKKTVVIGIVLLILTITTLGISFRPKDTNAVTDTGYSLLEEQSTGIVAWGEVKYTHMKDINIDFPSIVMEVEVQEGDQVTLGQPLVTLDLSEYNGIVKKLEHQLSANQSALLIAETDISALQADIEQAQRELDRKTKEYHSDTNADIVLLKNSLNLAYDELSSAKTDLENYQSLYEAGAVSKTTLDAYKTSVDQRQKAVDDIETNLQKIKIALQEELNKLNVALKSKQEQLSQLKRGNTANVTQQQDSISSLQVDLDAMIRKTQKEYLKDNKIISDIEKGIVQNIAVNEGSHLGVQGSPTRVLQIINVDSIIISAEVDEEFIKNVEVGETVEIVPTSLPDTTLTGTVTQIPNTAIEKNGRRIVPVLIKPEDPDYRLKPGYTADVYFSN